MKKVCPICGFNGENMWRDGKYYCASCGSEIEATQPDAPTNTPKASNEMVINATCPICKNTANNTFKDGKAHCALCGTSFDLVQPGYNGMPNTGFSPNYPINTARIAELEKARSKKVGWGIVWLIIFWPVSIYFFYQAYQLNEEIKRLK